MFTATELMNMVFPEPRWAVPGLVAEGATLLCGPPKLGKSWLSLNLAVAIASGGRALGKVEVEQGDVLYLALEDSDRRLQSRLQLVLAGGPVPDRLTFSTYCEPLSCGGTETIEAWLDTHPEARLVIIDVLTRVRDVATGRTNQYDLDYMAMASIKDIADRYGVAVLVVHHTRKQGADDFLEQVSGTQGLAGAADAVAVLSRSRGSAEATLSITGRDVEEASYAMNFAADIGTWQMLEGPASDYDQSEQRLRIIAAVRENEGIGPKQIAEMTGINYDVVKHLVRKMLDDVLDTDGSGHYFPVHRSLHSPRSPEVGETDHVGEEGEQSERREMPQAQGAGVGHCNVDPGEPRAARDAARARAASWTDE
jgi:hypothetical protein